MKQIDERRIALPDRRQSQYARAALVGLCAGVMAVLFQYALLAAESLRNSCLVRLHAMPAWAVIVWPCLAALCAGTAGWLTARYAPEASGSGIPHVKGVLMHVRVLNWRRVLPVKFVGGVLAIGAGLSLGREGPTVQMGAACGKAVSDLLGLPRRSRAQLIAAGAGAGLAAAFNAPLAGFIFVLEELQRELSPLTYGTALIAAVVADIVTRTLVGQHPSFHISGFPTPSLHVLPLFVLVGGFAGLMGVVFNCGLLAVLRLSHTLRNVAAWQRAATMGLVVGFVAWWMPQAIGGGHATAEGLMRGQYASIHLLGFLALLLAVKLTLTIGSYGVGVPGGIFAPLLVLGAIVGTMTGLVCQHLLPTIATNPAAFAVIGMGAAFAAIVRAPLTGVVLIVEMTNNYEQMFALLVACMTAYLLSERLANRPIYEALLDYDLQRSGYATHPQAHQPVSLNLAVEPGSAMDQRLIRELNLPDGCLITGLKRAGRDIVPVGATRLQAGDYVHVLIPGDLPQAAAQVQARARA